MDAKDHKVIAVLGDQKRFVVPIYQRQYKWTDARLQDFWDDVSSKAEEILEGLAKYSHYMGALILAPGVDGYTIGSTPRVQVVDGQQRLTTFQLFLAAIRDVAVKKGVPELAEATKDYIFNRLMSGDSDEDAKYKLVPTPDDKAIFHLLMDGGLVAVRSKHPEIFYQSGNIKKGDAPTAVRATDFFIGRIERFARFGIRTESDMEEEINENAPEVQRHRVQALLSALLECLKLVVITLSDEDDAQVIFESLNSKAEPLLAMELVRNNIFHRAEEQGVSAEKLFTERWQSFIGTFWEEDAPRAKPRRKRIDDFLGHSLTAQTGEETPLRELYAAYRAFARPKGKPRFKNVEDEVDALLKYVNIYRKLEAPVEDEPLANLGRKLATWEVSTAYPLVFVIAGSDADDDTKAYLYKLIYSYLVRRAICGLTQQSLNKTFPRLVHAMLSGGVSRETFRKAFSEQTGHAVRFPSDEELTAEIRKRPLYKTFNRKERLADILWQLELDMRDKFSVNTPKPVGLSIEHVLPQTWAQYWDLQDGRKAPLDLRTGADTQMLEAIARRQDHIHTLGNLTLMTEAGNPAASNSDFTVKAPWLKKSLLALNLAIVGKPKWDEDMIASRAKELARRAITIWPHPSNN